LYEKSAAQKEGARIRKKKGKGVLKGKCNSEGKKDAQKKNQSLSGKKCFPWSEGKRRERVGKVLIKNSLQKIGGNLNRRIFTKSARKR